MSGLPIWLHIGLGKTGTTTLQRSVFSRHPQILYLGKNWIDSEEAKRALIQLVRSRDRKFDIAATKAIFSQMLDQGRSERSNAKIALLSEEDFTTCRFVDPGTSAARARQVFGDARILMVVREPVEWLQSMYFFRLALRFPETLDGFTNWVCAGLRGRMAGTDIGQILMGEWARCYADLFGGNNVTIMRYEDFLEDGPHFIKATCDLLGIASEVAIDLYESGVDRTTRKSRVTERQAEFLLSFELVRNGRYAEYLERIRPILDTLNIRARKRFEELLPPELSGERTIVEQRLRDASVFVDRAAGDVLREGKRAAAVLDHNVESHVREIAGPGLRYIASNFNPAVRFYFENVQQIHT